MATTKSKSVPEALRMIAGWIEEGREIEINQGFGWSNSMDWALDHNEKVHRAYMDDAEYRAKPRKPRSGILTCPGLKINLGGPLAIELTEEVKEACKAAGIEVE